MMRRCLAEMHLRDLTIIIGMTETSPVCLQTAPNDPFDRKVGSVGSIHPHVEVKVVDAEGDIVAPGVAGEFCTRGYSVMLGYWNDPEKTREAIDADGWMHTGDLGTLDAEGYGNVVGRSKDMAIRGGENVYPVEIENVLYQHPAVADAQVFGIPDPHMGEGTLHLDPPQARSRPLGGGDSRLPAHPHRPLQGATVRPLRLRVPHHGDRQGSEIRHARPYDRGTWPHSDRNSLNNVSDPAPGAAANQKASSKPRRRAAAAVL
jgi:hypothetical protein